MRFVAALILTLCGLAAVALAAPSLELRVDSQRERVEAIVVGEPPREPVFLRDIERGRRVPAVGVTANGATGFTAVFDLRTLSPDGKAHTLALEWGDVELARAQVVLPAETPPSPLRWLVIVGPLLGLAMIALAVWIGRRRAGGASRTSAS